jgi:hypothetical protein
MVKLMFKPIAVKSNWVAGVEGFPVLAVNDTYARRVASNRVPRVHR